jgi:hypothetical protein
LFESSVGGSERAEQAAKTKQTNKQKNLFSNGKLQQHSVTFSQQAADAPRRARNESSHQGSSTRRVVVL